MTTKREFHACVFVARRRYKRVADGAKTRPTNKSAHAISRSMKFVGEDLSVFSGSFQTAKMTNAFSTTVIIDKNEQQMVITIASPVDVVRIASLHVSLIIATEAFQNPMCPSSAAMLFSPKLMVDRSIL